jgi:hypothetical protein
LNKQLGIGKNFDWTARSIAQDNDDVACLLDYSISSQIQLFAWLLILGTRTIRHEGNKK